MKKEWAHKWVAALRSGEYEQGKRRLTTASNKYCCLGVLCEITGLDYAPNALFPPVSVDNKVRANGKWTIKPTGGHPRKLPDLNDNDGYTFNQIADLIEQYYDQL